MEDRLVLPKTIKTARFYAYCAPYGLDFLEAYGAAKRGDGDCGVSGSVDCTDSSQHVRRRHRFFHHDRRDYGPGFRRRLRRGWRSFSFDFGSLTLDFRSLALGFGRPRLYDRRRWRRYIAQVLQIEDRNNDVLVRNFGI